jgi:Fur family peroxide stress response transcriptional regulator
MTTAARKAKLQRSPDAPEMPRSDEGVIVMQAAVRAAGLKLTPQRLAIVRELASDRTHPTAQELYERLLTVQPTMSFATVYNTLDTLASAGLCAALSLAPGAARFDGNMAPHHHAVCDRCGLVRDVPVSRDKPPTGALPAALGFRLRTVERIYRGLCAACATESPMRPAKKDHSSRTPTY